MGTIRKLITATLVLCASQGVHGQEARQDVQQEQQQEEQQAMPRPWVLGANSDSLKIDRIPKGGGLTPFNSTSPLAAPAMSEVQDSFKVYPAVVGADPLPTDGEWSVPSSPVLAFLPACKATKASCLEVDYTVASRNVVCRWTVLFPAPTIVKGKEVQTRTVINEDAHAARYTMMVQLQKGMNYASVTTKAPIYPAAAKASDWNGSVSVDIVVSPAGNVVLVPGVRGPALLRPSAKQAVLKWVYGPTKLGGEDVARAFTVQVNYSVGGETVKPK